MKPSLELDEVLRLIEVTPRKYSVAIKAALSVKPETSKTRNRPQNGKWSSQMESLDFNDFLGVADTGNEFQACRSGAHKIL
jgi:hypothetical protein